MPVTTRRDGAVAYVMLDFPPVNAIGQAARQGLMQALDWVAAEPGLERVILSGVGRAFAAGGDAREFDGPALDPQLPDVVNRIEACAVPWIAALHGPALGGGLELALACRYRVATPEARLGLPEVGLGVVPGAGGTQRLPRLIGVAAALTMIREGKPVSGARGLELGLVDELAEDPLFAAFEVNGEALATCVPVGDLPCPEADAEALANAEAQAASRQRGQLAPAIAIELVRLACTAPLTEGMAVERGHFLELRQAAQARALRHMFFAERAAKAPEGLIAPPAELTHVAVVGGGTMGAGIAYALLNAGLRVTLLETDADGAARARANVEKIIADSLKRGLIDEACAEARGTALTTSADYAAAAGAGLAIEAAFESLEVKQQVFARLEAALGPEALLATNTSYLDVNQIAAGLAHPSRFLGLHFFAPAHIMKLLEIVRADATSEAALATGFALGARLKKIPVLAGVCDGFIGNRILARYREAADTLLMDGTNPWEIDEAMENFGYAMGPYAAQDLSGLDIAFANRRRQDASRDPARRYIPIADRMVNEGRLGRKTAVGWYRYPGGGGRVVDPLIEDLIREEAHFAKVTRRDFTADEIRERLLLAMINEAAALLDEGIARSASDIDLVMVTGYGFPRWRGGLMYHADTLGAARILARLEAFAAEDPLAWAPAPLIRRLAATGASFAAARPGA